MAQEVVDLCIHKTDPHVWKLAVFMQMLGIRYSLHFSDDMDRHNVYPPQLSDPNTKTIQLKYRGIIRYLQEQYDTKNLFGGKDIREEVDVLAWLFFQVSGFSPTQSRIDWFLSRNMEIAKTINSYDTELRRLYDILGAKLRGKEFVKDFFM
eukprot:Phypoly_transcript_21554.p1 GENE.Phypoly_transcript_21554~~Phypoly_transcript_21554.p1  ORF type:complete len:172 (+),score=28.82 Phypoly_transcript_21554:66-518(+)